MARVRSPNYPALSLKEALERVAKVHERERQHPAAKDVVIKGMGYNAVHGASLGALSAAVKYGLLEQDGRGKDYRVSDRALAILHPHSPKEKAEALNEAARSPALFAELLDYFKGDLPSDDNLRAYLVRQGFTTSSLPSVIQSFRDTMELVTPISGDYNSSQLPPARSEPENPPMIPGTATARHSALSPSPALGAPMRVLFNGVQLEVSAILADADAVDRLVKALQANKALLPEKKMQNEEAAN